jgi:hypothetical protein
MLFEAGAFIVDERTGLRVRTIDRDDPTPPPRRRTRRDRQRRRRIALIDSMYRDVIEHPESIDGTDAPASVESGVTNTVLEGQYPYLIDGQQRYYAVRRLLRLEDDETQR